MSVADMRETRFKDDRRNYLCECNLKEKDQLNCIETVSIEIIKVFNNLNVVNQIKKVSP